MRHAAPTLLLPIPPTSASARMDAVDCLALADAVSPLFRHATDLLSAVGEADRITETVRLRPAETDDRVALEQAAVSLSRPADTIEAMIKATRQTVTEIRQRCLQGL